MAAPLPAAGPAVGIDLASVARVSALLERRPRLAERCFTPAERADCAGRPERWAARWAVKEAVRKLYGSLGVSPLPAFAGIEVGRDGGGAPRVRVGGRETAIAVSHSHDGGMAAAIVLLAGPPPPPGPLDRDPVLAPPVGMRLPARPADGHKGSFGTVCVVAGSHAYSGAAYLAGMGAARGGAGLVRLCVPASLHPAMVARCVEVMPQALPDDGRGVLGPAAAEALVSSHLVGARALVVGPGLGRDPATGIALARLLAALPCPAVVDADALNLAAGAGLAWPASGPPVVLTPHPAEMGRLAGIGTGAVQAGRSGVARRYAAEHGAVVVLKGRHTVVAAPDGREHVDGHAVVALATGGTGDVLAGLCGALIAGGLDAFEAAVAAVTVHAEAGAAVEAERGRAGALATDLLEALPAAQERLRRALERRAAR